MNYTKSSFFVNSAQDYPINFSIIPFGNLEKIAIETFGKCLVDCFETFARLSDTQKTQKLYASAMKALDISENSPLYKAGAIISGKLDNGLYHKEDNQYHNLQHTVEVMLTVLHLALLNNALKIKPLFSNYEIAILFLSALIHDLNHDGLGNQGDNFKLEQHAFNTAKNDLSFAGITLDEQNLIEALILSTDINEPTKLVSKINEYHEKKLPQKKPEIPKNMKKLKIFLDNAKASYMSLILCDADLIPSTALTFEKTKIQSRNIYYEQTQINPEQNKNDAKESFLTFSKNFLSDGFRSNAGKLYNNNLKKIIAFSNRN